MALLGLANTLSIEGANHGVHVNTITPLAHSPLSQGVIPATLLNILNWSGSPLIAIRSLI